VRLEYVCSPLAYVAVLTPQIIAFFVGYFTQDIRLSLYVGLAGTALTFLAVVPPWPFYNKNPEGWLPASNATQGYSIDVDGQKVG
jgi:signal peptidase complex subunit 1